MKILQFFQDDAGNLSSKRLLALAWGFGVLSMWIRTCIVSNAMAPLSWEHAGVVFSLAGVVAAGKWGEKAGG